MSLDDHEPPEYRQLLTEEQLLLVTERMLAHFGTFAVGGAVAVGVYSDEVGDRVCTFVTPLADHRVMPTCEYLSGLSWKMQMGLAAVAIVVLLTSDWMNRRRHRREDDDA